MNLRQKMRCIFGYHHRNGYRVRWHDGIRHSVCKGCGRRMIREDIGWRIARPGELAR